MNDLPASISMGGATLAVTASTFHQLKMNPDDLSVKDCLAQNMPFRIGTLPQDEVDVSSVHFIGRETTLIVSVIWSYFPEPNQARHQ